MAESDLKSDISADEWAAATAGQPAAGRAAMSGSTVPPGSAAPAGGLDIILDIPVEVTVELGRAKIPIRSLLQLAQGSVIELDRLAGEPLDVLVNGCLIAQGEVVVVNDKFGIRLTDVIGPDERLRRLQR